MGKSNEQDSCLPRSKNEVEDLLTTHYRLPTKNPRLPTWLKAALPGNEASVGAALFLKQGVFSGNFMRVLPLSGTKFCQLRDYFFFREWGQNKFPSHKYNFYYM